MVVADGNTHAVAVGVASHDEVVSKFFSSGHGEGQRSWFLRVWRVHRGKVSVRRGLGLKHVHLSEPPSLERFREQRDRGSVKCRKHDAQSGIALAVERKRFKSTQVGLVGFATEGAHRAGPARPLHVSQGHCAHSGQQLFVLRRNNLPAVTPVHFVSVVLFGVVRSRDHNSRRASVQAHRKTQFRGRAQGVKQPHVHPICR